MEELTDKQILQEVLQSKPISYRADFAKICGSVTAGVMLSQAYYWSGKSTKHGAGWFEKTSAEWEQETALTDKQQQTARFILSKRGFMESERKGDRGRMCSRLNCENIYDALVEYYKSDRQNGDSKTGKKADLHRQNRDSKTGKKADLSLQRVLTESTTETTKSAAQAPPALMRRLTDLIGDAHKHLTGDVLVWEGKGKAYGNAMKSIMKIVESLPDDDERFKAVRRKCASYVMASAKDDYLKNQGVTPLSILSNWNKLHYKSSGSTSEFGMDKEQTADVHWLDSPEFTDEKKTEQLTEWLLAGYMLPKRWIEWEIKIYGLLTRKNYSSSQANEILRAYKDRAARSDVKTAS